MQLLELRVAPQDGVGMDPAATDRATHRLTDRGHDLDPVDGHLAATYLDLLGADD
eukprot:COSAG06_NODE_62871_length_264_cov_0.484848_2_plen_54_part_01